MTGKREIKKVLLINPPYPFEEHPSPPFGLLSLAAYLAEKGYEVKIEDYIIEQCTAERFADVINRFRPDIVGATAVSMTVKKSLSILRGYRDISPGIITVMGGPHVTFDAEGILNTGLVDYIVRGEGELTFTELLGTLSAGGDTGKVNGISLFSGGSILHTPDRGLIDDINILPYPARDLVSLSKYRAMDLPVNMVTSRGCPHSCIFCIGSRMVGKRLRYFSTERVIDEFEMLSGLGFSQINISDDLFTSNRKRCMEICDGIISRGIKQEWSAFARVDTISPDLLHKLKEAGCTTLCFGIESGNQEILDRVKKKITIEKCRRAAELCREAGISPLASYILGLPGETEETVQKTIDFAWDVNMNFGIHILAPFPGTEIREKAQEYGITVLTDDWDLYDANRSVSSTGGIPPERIDRIVHGFYKYLDDYMKDVELKCNSGGEISEKDEFMLRKKDAYNFSMEIIKRKLIENYSATGSSDQNEFTMSLSRHLQENTGRDYAFVEYQVRRLLSKGCVKISHNDSSIMAVWV